MFRLFVSFRRRIRLFYLSPILCHCSVFRIFTDPGISSVSVLISWHCHRPLGSCNYSLSIYRPSSVAVSLLFLLCCIVATRLVVAPVYFMYSHINFKFIFYVLRYIRWTEHRTVSRFSVGYLFLFGCSHRMTLYFIEFLPSASIFFSLVGYLVPTFPTHFKFSVYPYNPGIIIHIILV